jgi:hypothetical protein
LNNVPIELQENNVPETNIVSQLEQLFEQNKNTLSEINISENPKIFTALLYYRCTK